MPSTYKCSVNMTPDHINILYKCYFWLQMTMFSEIFGNQFNHTHIVKESYDCRRKTCFHKWTNSFLIKMMRIVGIRYYNYEPAFRRLVRNPQCNCDFVCVCVWGWLGDQHQGIQDIQFKSTVKYYIILWVSKMSRTATQKSNCESATSLR